MGLLTPNDIQNFRSLYTLQLRYLLSAENQIVKGLEGMINHTTDSHLKQAFQSHQQETRIHAERLEKLLADNGGETSDKKCAVTAALVASAENIISESSEGPVRDAGLLASAQKVEHFEIASYGTARDWARQLGLHQHAETLQKTLDEEKHADHLLNGIAQTANSTAATVAAA
jgi:ferritin-like metal-binding protein YciE